MRRSSLFLAVLSVILLTALILSAGCSSRDSGSTGSTLPAREQTPQVTRPVAPSVPLGPSVPSVPGTTVITPPAFYQNTDELKQTLYTLSQEWQPTGLSCTGTTCSGSFVDTTGNTLVIQATIYKDADAARAAFQQKEQAGSSYRQVPMADVGDESYAWLHLAQAELGARKSNLVAVFDYTMAGGSASADEIRELAAIAGARV